MRSFLLLTGTVLLLIGCKDDEIVPQDLGYGYWPTNTGHWVEYQVDSVWQEDEVGLRIESHYRLMEVVDSQYVDPEGRPSQRIERFVQDTTGTWLIKDIWTQTVTATFAERTEENLRKLKLAFAVRDYQRWNAHVFIGDDGLYFTTDDSDFEVEYDEIDEPWSNGQLSFDSTCTVVCTYPTNIVVTKALTERYAKNVGLVDQRWEQYNKQYNQQTQQLDSTGFRKTMTVVAYGN
jgi:hypothetical protein